MAEKQPSPGAVGTPRAAKVAVRSDEPSLVVRKQPPRNVFIDEWFELEIGLDLPRVEHQVRNYADLELVPSLRNSKTGHVTPEFVLTADPEVVILSPRMGSPRRNRKIRFRVRSAGPETVGSFFIQFSHRSDSEWNTAFRGTSSPLQSRAFGTVDYKIVIAMDDQWESIWYKDEGGRDKCMEITAELYNKSKVLQTGEQVPLHLTLLYDNDDEPVRVTKQDLLRTLGPGKIEIDRATGQGKLRFRIEDVSKNHQGQDFRVEVSPDLKQRKIRDIAPGMTPAVSVRSKRNKRARGKELLGKPSSLVMGGVSGGSDSKLSPTSFAQTRGMMHPSDEQHAPRDSPFDGPDSARLREAMKGVIQWTEEVVTGLYPLQWQVIGYAQNADGSPDYNRPYHNMPNPNGYINRVLNMYSDSTREQLRVLLHAVEQATSDRMEDSYPLAVAHQQRESAAADPYGLMHNTPPLPLAGHVQMPVQLQPTIASRRVLMAQQQQQQQQQNVGLHPGMASVEDFSSKHDFFMNYPGLQQPNSAAAVAAAAKYHSNHAAAVSTLASRHLRSGGTGHGRMDDVSAIQHRHSQAAHPALAAGVLHRASSGGAYVMGSASALTTSARGGDAQQQAGQYDEDDSLSNTTREAEVEYVLAKQYKAVRTGERLGFPAYSASKEILGFYRESSTKVGPGQFIPIGHHREDFGPLEILQATQILEDALLNKSEAVHILKDWGNITNLIDHALVYDWTKDISGGGGGSSRGGGVANTHSESSSGTE